MLKPMAVFLMICFLPLYTNEFKIWEFGKVGATYLKQRSGFKDGDADEAKNQILSSFVYIFQKTTRSLFSNLYIACELIDWDPENRDLEDPESSSTIEWIEPNALISIMQQQGIRFLHRVDADESGMIRRALPYLRF